MSQYVFAKVLTFVNPVLGWCRVSVVDMTCQVGFLPCLFSLSSPCSILMCVRLFPILTTEIGVYICMKTRAHVLLGCHGDLSSIHGRRRKMWGLWKAFLALQGNKLVCWPDFQVAGAAAYNNQKAGQESMLQTSLGLSRLAILASHSLPLHKVGEGWQIFTKSFPFASHFAAWRWGREDNKSSAYWHLALIALAVHVELGFW